MGEQLRRSRLVLQRGRIEFMKKGNRWLVLSQRFEE